MQNPVYTLQTLPNTFHNLLDGGGLGKGRGLERAHPPDTLHDLVLGLLCIDVDIFFSF